MVIMFSQLRNHVKMGTVNRCVVYDIFALNFCGWYYERGATELRSTASCCRRANELEAIISADVLANSGTYIARYSAKEKRCRSPTAPIS
jgi:hypothetical protein